MLELVVCLFLASMLTLMSTVTQFISSTVRFRFLPLIYIPSLFIFFISPPNIGLSLILHSNFLFLRILRIQQPLRSFVQRGSCLHTPHIVHISLLPKSNPLSSGSIRPYHPPRFFFFSFVEINFYTLDSSYVARVFLAQYLNLDFLDLSHNQHFLHYDDFFCDRSICALRLKS